MKAIVWKWRSGHVYDIEAHNKEKNNLEKEYEEKEKILKEEFGSNTEKITQSFTTQIIKRQFKKSRIE
jgi:hypothetical protein